MAELADALDSGSSEGFLHAGSSPVSRTIPNILIGFESPIRILVFYPEIAKV